jgi:hypothetical protein
LPCFLTAQTRQQVDWPAIQLGVQQLAALYSAAYMCNRSMASFSSEQLSASLCVFMHYLRGVYIGRHA